MAAAHTLGEAAVIIGTRQGKEIDDRRPHAVEAHSLGVCRRRCALLAEFLFAIARAFQRPPFPARQSDAGKSAR
jgi:hypothetical protein